MGILVYLQLQLSLFLFSINAWNLLWNHDFPGEARGQMPQRRDDSGGENNKPKDSQD